jgi:hypothetical protein
MLASADSIDKADRDLAHANLRVGAVLMSVVEDCTEPPLIEIDGGEYVCDEQHGHA